MMTDQMHDAELYSEMTQDERIDWLARRVDELERRVDPLEKVIQKINGDTDPMVSE